MPPSLLLRWFCRVYGIMLYAYPRDFRLQFGGEMQQLFRDRCRQLTRTFRPAKLASFRTRERGRLLLHPIPAKDSRPPAN